MSVGVATTPADRIAVIGPGVRRKHPTRCWAETNSGARCRNSGAFTIKPLGEPIPYAICGLHARIAAGRLLVLLAPDWDSVVKRYSEGMGLHR